jgi:predicted dithiol-disulfide oxidoreductase (DUF899 family)
MAATGDNAALVDPVTDLAEERLDRVFFALSDPVRRKILERLDEILAGPVRRPGRGPGGDRGPARRQGQTRIEKEAARPQAPALIQTNGDRIMIESHKVVSREEWVEARKALLAREKEFTRARDRLSEERRDLPWERVDKTYSFDGPRGSETLADLFDGRSQLIVYHFMFDPGWEAGCRGCSFWADNFERNVVHLAQRDVTLIAVSRAPLARLEAFKERMGWSFKWLSSGDGDFNFDYQASFPQEGSEGGEIFYNYTWRKAGMADLPGISVFYKDRDGAIFHTYSTYARGLDMLNAAYHYLDLVPKGRDEAGEQPMAWLRHRDSYES